MNFRKIFASLILSVATFAVFACQYTGGGSTMNAYTRQYKRCIYLAGVNSHSNHIAGVTYNAVEHDTLTVNGESLNVSSRNARYTAYNHMTVYLPLTVYIGVFDLCGGRKAINGMVTETDGSGSELQGITMMVQYRVLPESSWHTAATKFFASGDLAVMSRKKLFGATQIDCEAATGSTVLIRLYVCINTYRQLNDNGGVLETENYLENADLTSPAVSSASDIAATEESLFSVTTGGYGGTQGNMTYIQTNELTPDIHFCNPLVRPENHPFLVTYLDGWTPQFVMAVKIGSKRRPGK